MSKNASQSNFENLLGNINNNSILIINNEVEKQSKNQSFSVKSKIPYCSNLF